MIGAGFIKDMISATKRNRALLKSEGHPYSNFDKSYITDSKVKRQKKKVSERFFKRASPAYYRQLSASLQKEKQDIRLRKISLLISIFLATGILFWFILFA